jgi:Heterokaryon incompatibility protein (HET)
VLDDDSQIWFEGAPLSYHTNGDFAANEIREWLNRCDDCHNCRSKAPSLLPTRVIDVGGSEGRHLKIHTPKNGERAEYLALSYCWGGTQKLTTTSSTLHANLKELDPKVLPKTIWDAIQVTRKLGIPYLWVDALCILQDCPQDKSREIHRMGFIYKNAAATIAAADAATSDFGFLGVRSQIYACFPVTASGGGMKSVAVVNRVKAHWESGPLETRAWTFQEAILSPRIIFYGKHNCVWIHCQSTTLRPLFDRQWELPSMFTWLKEDVLGLKTEPACTEDSRFRIWRRLIEEYSGRKLTDPEDRLPALAGVASELSRVWQDEYLAGAWKSFLIKSIGWSLDPKARDDLPHSACPSGRLRPTWSWASINRKVIFQDFQPDAEALECSVELFTPDTPFGKTKAGLLRLRAVIMEPSEEEYLEMRWENSSSESKFTVSMDYSSQISLVAKNAKFVHLGSDICRDSRGNITSYVSHGLIAVATGHDYHVRIGSFSLSRFASFDHVLDVFSGRVISRHSRSATAWKRATVKMITLV